MKYFLERLKNAGLTDDQIKVVQACMAEYALSALLDTSIAREAEFLCEADAQPTDQ